MMSRGFRGQLGTHRARPAGTRGSAKPAVGQTPGSHRHASAVWDAVCPQRHQSRAHQASSGNGSCSRSSGRQGDEGSSPEADWERTHGEKRAACHSQEPIPAVSTPILNVLPKFQGCVCRAQEINSANKLLPNREYTWTLQESI